MNWFEKQIGNIFNRSAPYAEPDAVKETSPEVPYSHFPWFGFHGAGTVDESAALKLAAFYDGVNTISDDLAQLPISIYRKTAEGREVFSDHPAHFLISSEPEPGVRTSFIWRKLMYATALIRGNHYTRIHRNSYTGEITELELLDQWKVNPVKYKKENWYKINGEEKLVHSSEMIHIRNFSLNGDCGRGVIEYAAESMGVSLAVQKYGRDFFDNSSNPTGTLSSEQTISPKDLKAIRDSWNQNYSGSGPKGVAVLHSGMKYQQIYLSPEATQFISSRKFSVLDVARWLKIPPHKLKDLEKSAFTNIESQNIDYVQSCLMSWVVQTEQELNMKLFTPSEKKAGCYVKINLSGLLRGDNASRSQYYKDLFFIGALSPNDIRKLEDKNPREGGDEYFTPVNMQTQEQIEKSLQNEKE